jgi:hypothetical protein
MALAENLAAIRERVAAAAHRAGRDSASVTLVAVSKTHPVETVLAAARQGQVNFGENRVEEALAKIQAAPHLQWHMLGHIQSRKVKDVIAAGFALIHSVDTLKLAEKLSRAALAANRTQPVLLECNVSGEASKAGFAAHTNESWPAVLEEFGRVAALPNLQVRGLMMMAPFGTDHETARPYFARLQALREAVQQQWPHVAWAELSMGMTDDFEGAIAEGATLVRVGRAIFGERDYV